MSLPIYHVLENHMCKSWDQEIKWKFVKVFMKMNKERGNGEDMGSWMKIKNNYKG